MMTRIVNAVRRFGRAMIEAAERDNDDCSARAFEVRGMLDRRL